MTLKNRITTIAFDYGGVMARKIDDTYLTHMAGAAGADTERFTASLWKYRGGFDAGEFDAASYWKMVVEDATGQLPQNHSAADLTKTLMDLDSFGWTIINPAMIRWISTLRQEGYRRFLLSNMAAETFDMILKDSPLLAYFERVILSGWLRINKPDERIFQEAARQMEVEPDQILFIDDLPHNVEGARRAGFHALPFTGAADLAEVLAKEYPEIPRRGLI